MTQSIKHVARIFGMDEQTLRDYWENLSPEDQQILCQLLGSARVQKMFTLFKFSYLFPVELLLLTMLIGHHKALRFLIDELNHMKKL
jgi:hypothetical protein